MSARLISALVLVLWLLPSPPSLAVDTPINCSEWMASPPDAWRALPPETTDTLKRALSQGDPPLHLWRATLVCDQLDGAVCTAPEGEGSCVAFTLTDPDRQCKGLASGPFCVTFADGQSPPGLESTLLTRLGALSGIWRAVDRPPGAPADLSATEQETATAMDAALWPLTLSALVLLFLVALGSRIGRITTLPLWGRMGMPVLLREPWEWDTRG